MTYLSSNQLKQYEDEGFVSPINIFSKEKAKEIRDEIELIEKTMPGELEKSGRYNAHLISPLLDEVAHNSKILDAVESLIGENILICSTTLFIKNPNEKGFVSYHQDAKYIGLGVESELMTQLINPVEFTTVVKRLRSFFDDLNFQEVHTQNRLSILAACEDPTTVATYNYNGKIWPLPQTGQMWLEYELLTKPDLPGCYCLSTSYRQEQNPKEGRHELIFPMFEFEAPGDFNDLLKMENDLCKHLGFKCERNLAPYDDLDFPGGLYQSVLA